MPCTYNIQPGDGKDWMHPKQYKVYQWIDKWLGSELYDIVHLFNTYQKDEDSVLLKILNQALDHLHPVHKIPNYSKHPVEKVKSIVRNQTTEKLRKYPHTDAMNFNIICSIKYSKTYYKNLKFH